MPDLTEEDLRDFARRLRARREELRWAVHDALIESKRTDYIGLAGQVHDAGEESVADLLEGLSLSTLNREVEELADVEAALARIGDGAYGVCTDCGDPIARARLEAYPTAKRCMPCQTRRETERRGGRDHTPSL